jgi:hypothetical protein
MKRVAIMLSVLMAVAPCMVQAQAPIRSGQEAIKQVTGAAGQAATAYDEPKQVSFKLEDGERITLRNRFGPIVVTGTGGDTLEAAASLIKQGTIAFKFRISMSRQGKSKIMIATAVTTPGQAMSEKEKKAVGVAQAATPTVPPAKQEVSQGPQKAQPPQPGAPRTGVARGGGSPARPAARAPQAERSETPSQESLRGVGEIKLEVKLPRNARIDLIDSRRYALMSSGSPSYLTNTRNNVSVTNIETPISIISSGDIRATKVGGIEARTRASSIYIKEASGPINISTATGSVVVKEAEGDVRAVSISGPISIECVRGRAEAGTANGSITLTGIGGDLEVTTTGGTISFTGAIREGGRYRLKSMSGDVRMFVQREPPGFLASLSSYKGQIVQDFDLKTELSANTATSDLPSTQGQPLRRMTGRFGEGDARITLDSFSGTVQLGHAPSEVWKRCR